MKSLMTRTNGSTGRENLCRLAVSAALLALTACGGGSNQDDGLELDLSNLQDVPEIGAASDVADADIMAAIDTTQIASGDTVIVKILQNDDVSVGSKLQLISAPDADFEGTDSVEYILVAADGTQSRGMLYLAVVCADCIAETPATVLTGSDEFGNPYCTGPDPDRNGDGWGWENNTSCVMPKLGAALPGLTAKADSLKLNAGETAAIPATLNDVIADRSDFELSIDSEPTVGEIKATSGGVIVYTAPNNYTGQDSLMYSLSDSAGNTSMASIDFDIECPDCTIMKGLRLSWPSNPSGEGVESYKVFFGPDENLHTSSMLSQVTTDDFSGSAPNVVFDIANDLQVTTHEGGCFRVTAVRGSEESEPSDPICFGQG